MLIIICIYMHLFAFKNAFVFKYVFEILVIGIFNKYVVGSMILMSNRFLFLLYYTRYC